MYHPYFRGKQFELLAIRETATTLASAGFVAVIEPVRESLSGLSRTLEAVRDAGGRAVVIVNPCHGDHRTGGNGIASLLDRDFRDIDTIGAGVLLKSDTPSESVPSLFSPYIDQDLFVIHSGFTDAKVAATALNHHGGSVTNVFIEDQANMLYRRHFSGSRILVRDGFERKRNSDYGVVDNFSDLHATYSELGMDGYGDFLTVGDHYSEGGGPAYAVAIHLTFIDPTQDDAMFIYHFVSDSNDTPTDPAGKFAQALAKLVWTLDHGDSHLLESTAVAEFRQLHERGHFPGLGYVKKLSIKHHIETLADYHLPGN